MLITLTHYLHVSRLLNHIRTS